MGVFLSYDPFAGEGDPIPKDMTTKGFPKPEFLDRVRTSHFVHSSHAQFRRYYRSDEQWLNDDVIKRVNMHFDYTRHSYFARAAKLVFRKENSDPDRVFHVVGVTSMCEGIVEHIGSEEGNGFAMFRKHPIAILSSRLNERVYALLADLHRAE